MRQEDIIHGRTHIACALALFAATALAGSADMAIQRAHADLAMRLHAPAKAIQTVSVDALVWRDASMGCGRRNESYAQIEVSGYRIILEYNGERFDYRVREDGVAVLCEQALQQR